MFKRILMLTAVVVMAFAVASPVAAKSCKANYIHGSNAALVTGHKKALAREAAISSWEFKAITSLGPPWNEWRLAANRSFRCIRSFGRWKCTAKARPCRP